MYLKSLELIGFKSFADKIKVDIEPGMTCIVGPNGCGKSNISDCIRWVLGEQSAKALRGSKMEDVIFNGTDTRKPLGMAEVNITLADCEAAMNMEFNEVTVTRRVFRSGEGQYFINKAPCRLKDIQRLFMDTGIGTASYSMMEQGRIDRVLSSRPEDRREIFEEASGITKFKVDKKEAMRKLDHTEANLLRLADVIREVKRQIGSLQRQAGKARRYKDFRDELRKLDVYATRIQLKNADATISDIEAKISAANSHKNIVQREVDELEQSNSQAREQLLKIERNIGSVLESSVQAQNNLDRTHEMIAMNDQRIEEYRDISNRDSQEISVISEHLAEQKTQLSSISAEKEKTADEEAQAEAQLNVSNEKFNTHQQQIDTSRNMIIQLREEQVELESTISRLRNQIVEIESEERSSVIQRERLAAEKTQLSRILAGHEEKKAGMTETLETMRQEIAKLSAVLNDCEEKLAQNKTERRDCQMEASSLQSKAAATKARVDFLSEEEQAVDDFPGGAKLLLDDSNPLEINTNSIIGALADHVTADDGYATALEAALRSWLDAIIVTDQSIALDILKKLESRKAGSARLLTAEINNTEWQSVDLDGFTRLIDHVKPSPAARQVIGRILGNVFIANDLNSVPSSIPNNAAIVTREGALVRGNGCLEFWMTDAQNSNPLSRKNALAIETHKLAEFNENIEALQNISDNLESNAKTLENAVTTARAELDKSRQAAAQKEGECQVISRETETAREHLSTVSFELDSLNSQEESSDDNKNTIASKLTESREQIERIVIEIRNQTGELRKLEERHGEIQTDVTDRRIRFSTISQRHEHLDQQYRSVNSRVSELEDALKGRSNGVESYKIRIAKLSEEVAAAKGTLSALEEEVITQNNKADGMRKDREKKSQEIALSEQALADKRIDLEAIRGTRAEMDIRLTESRMKRQNMIDRVASEYGLTKEQVMEEAEPEWEGPPPSIDTIETNVAELRTKLDAMGPVNLVAIEEYKELEERYNFLTNQEEDLTKAKQQLVDMIKQINRTTSEMFKSTFDGVNTNFQEMFKKLFDGGSAKLVLINEEDVLDCGIEIIARPPGKRLQNISLLSGGERTMTAVALLFAIYLIKPSPFCLLDELDAALDDSNIGRFVTVLQSFVSQSQFIIITHNQHTMAAARAIYGVTMPEKGVSKIVSMKFKEAAKVAE